jgi:diguanylate cyclase (GGDEF)-like protein
MTVDVAPTWYQTWWFSVLKALLAALVIGLGYALRLRYVQRRSAELERLVEQRTQELTELQSQLKELAYSDPLTALPNRRMFNDFCRKFVAAAQRRASGFALLLIDLDKFKNINDTLGHDAGDALLVETAHRLTKVVRESDIVARLGGDEFAILLIDTGAADVASLCQRIVDAFITPAPFAGAQLRTSPSIGIARYPADGKTADALYKSADLALYEAKRSGRNTWRFAPTGGASVVEESVLAAGRGADACS